MTPNLKLVPTDEPMAGDIVAIRGKVLLGGRLVRAAVVVEEGRIARVIRDPREGDLPEQVIDADIVSPGLIDLQANGGFGADVGRDPEAIRTMAVRLPETGVTAFLPTIITSPADVYPAAFDAFERARECEGARPLGLHVEGPFLSAQRKGAHRRELIEGADPALIELFVRSDCVTLVTLAPERPVALEWIRRLHAQGIVVSLGHTDATLEQFVAGADAGARMTTHLFNAMSPFTHRVPGVIGAALVDDRLTAGLIADGVHTHRAALELAFRAKGVDRLALVTDMIAAAGMPEGSSVLGGTAVHVRDGAARLPDGTLAGSVLTMDQAVRNMVAWTSASVADVLRMATSTPAQVLSPRLLGRIEVGAPADLTLFDRDLHVQATMASGTWAYMRYG